MQVKGLRWWILAMVVLITIINYLDRGTLNYMWVANVKEVYPVTGGVGEIGLPYAIKNEAVREVVLYLKDGTIQRFPDSVVVYSGNTIVYTRKKGIAYELGLVDTNAPQSVIDDQLKKMYSYIYMFFMVAYGISQLVSGRLYDKIGTRAGFVVSALIWGTADMLTSLAKGVTSLSFFRVILGLGEAGPWPGAVKSNAEWFPVKERALAQGLFGAGGSVGNILAPIVISMLFLKFGWQTTFVIVGSLGILWIVPWWILNKAKPDAHSWITDEEKEYILSGQPKVGAAVVPAKNWSEILLDQRSYAVILGRFFLDPVWWMFVAWLPIYLNSRFNLDIKQVAFSAWVPYVGAAIGAITGGYFSGRLIKQGRSAVQARKIAITVGACIMLPAMILAAFATSALSAVLIMALILGGFQCCIVNIQTLPSDYHAGKTVGSLAGLGGAAAVAGTIITMLLVPYITKGSNWTMFFVMGAILVPLSLASVFFFQKKSHES